LGHFWAGRARPPRLLPPRASRHASRLRVCRVSRVACRVSRTLTPGARFSPGLLHKRQTQRSDRSGVRRPGAPASHQRQRPRAHEPRQPKPNVELYGPRPRPRAPLAGRRPVRRTRHRASRRRSRRAVARARAANTARRPGWSGVGASGCGAAGRSVRRARPRHARRGLCEAGLLFPAGGAGRRLLLHACLTLAFPSASGHGRRGLRWARRAGRRPSRQKRVADRAWHGRQRARLHSPAAGLAQVAAAAARHAPRDMRHATRATRHAPRATRDATRATRDATRDTRHAPRDTLAGAAWRSDACSSSCAAT
jgi:hypothetical protein